jgi:hypothetical protein
MVSVSDSPFDKLIEKATDFIAEINDDDKN